MAGCACRAPELRLAAVRHVAQRHVATPRPRPHGLALAILPLTQPTHSPCPRPYRLRQPHRTPTPSPLTPRHSRTCRNATAMPPFVEHRTDRGSVANTKRHLTVDSHAPSHRIQPP
ncbi:hypothetical protein GUJ93_ZPchr0016g2588 [Zizania palustris]|uniref:Uncharacterized protein n=1 Tax=Zizania palustris TaxID=103762 RepID=A0A8J5TGN0_ZIZPA|nr:hypothetical protein GUJ93_ZPchr0016g2588 [Zizania palustris]